jgi:hypothetical protein
MAASLHFVLHSKYIIFLKLLSSLTPALVAREELEG